MTEDQTSGLEVISPARVARPTILLKIIQYLYPVVLRDGEPVVQPSNLNGKKVSYKSEYAGCLIWADVGRPDLHFTGKAEREASEHEIKNTFQNILSEELSRLSYEGNGKISEYWIVCRRISMEKPCLAYHISEERKRSFEVLSR